MSNEPEDDKVIDTCEHCGADLTDADLKDGVCPECSCELYFDDEE